MSNQPASGPDSGLARSSPHGALGTLHATLSAGMLAQGLSALAGFAVVPILVHTLGSAQFGVLVVIISLGPWLIVLDAGLQWAVRLLVGEYRASTGGRAPRALLGSAWKISAGIMALELVVVSVAVVTLPLERLLGAQGKAAEGELMAAIAVFALPVVLSIPGSVTQGALDGVGRTVASASLTGLGPIAALPLTLAAARRGGGLVELALIQGLAIAIPRLCALVYWRWRPSLDTRSHPDIGRVRVVLVAQLASLLALSLAQTGLAPMIVFSQWGADAAATYGLAWRLVGGALIPLLVLTPFISGALAAARGSGWTGRHDSDLARLLLQAAGVGLLAGVVLIVFGPVAANLLGVGEVPMPRSLLVAGAAFLVATYVAVPLQAAFSGPGALRASVVVGAAVTIVALVGSLTLTARFGPAGPLWAATLAALLSASFWILVWRTRPVLLSEVHSVPGSRS